jgi:hypothetical protein
VTFAARATSAPHRSFCARPGAGTPVRIHLSKAVRLGPSTNGHAGGIELSYRLARTTPVTLLAAGPGASGPPTAIDFVPHVWGPGAGTGIVLATVPATVSTLDVGLDGGGCITRAAAGTFVPARG